MRVVDRIYPEDTLPYHGKVYRRVVVKRTAIIWERKRHVQATLYTRDGSEPSAATVDKAIQREGQTIERDRIEAAGPRWEPHNPRIVRGRVPHHAELPEGYRIVARYPPTVKYYLYDTPLSPEDIARAKAWATRPDHAVIFARRPLGERRGHVEEAFGAGTAPTPPPPPPRPARRRPSSADAAPAEPKKTYLSADETIKIIRDELTAAFPSTAFDVHEKKERRYGKQGRYTEIVMRWTDGPTLDEIHEAFKEIDRRHPDLWPPDRGGRFDRQYSDAAYARACEQVAMFFGLASVPTRATAAKLYVPGKSSPIDDDVRHAIEDPRKYARPSSSVSPELAVQIREHVTALTTAVSAAGAGLESDDKLTEWLAWGTAFADRVDPDGRAPVALRTEPTFGGT